MQSIYSKKSKLMVMANLAVKKVNELNAQSKRLTLD